MTIGPSVKDSKAIAAKVKDMASKIIAATSSSIQTPADPPHYYSSSSSTTRLVTPPHTSPSSSKPKPTHSQAVANIFDIMPSQIQHDLTELGDTQLDADEEERQMLLWCGGYDQLVRFTLLDAISIIMSFTVNRTRNPSASRTGRRCVCHFL